MFSSRYVRFSSLRFRRIVTGLAIATYLASVWGFPLPSGGHKDLSVAFPCQDHACGCQSAEQCWQDCCCYTPAQRLAWARNHNVPLSAEVQQELLAAAEAGTTHGVCCLADGHGHDRSDHDDQPDAHHDDADHSCAQCASHERDSSIGWVLGIEARKCRGLSTDWVASGASLPLTILPLWEFDWTPIGHVTTWTEPFSSVAFLPPVPPPRA